MSFRVETIMDELKEHWLIHCASQSISEPEVSEQRFAFTINL